MCISECVCVLSSHLLYYSARIIPINRSIKGSIMCISECVCVCIVIPFTVLFWTSDYTFRYNMWTHQPGSRRRKVPQEFFFFFFSAFLLRFLPSVFIARRIQPSLSLVDREVEFLCTHDMIVLHLLGMMLEKIPSSCVTAPRFELTSQRQKVSRLPTEPPGRPYLSIILIPEYCYNIIIIVRSTSYSAVRGTV